MATTYKQMPVGQLFEFDHSALATGCGAFAHGPWRKISARTYSPAAMPPVAGTGAHRVGSINARVILGQRAWCGGGR